MRIRAGIATACAAAAVASGGAAAQSTVPRIGPRISGYVTVMSDYRNRGLSQSGGDPAVLLGADYQHGSGFFAGARAANVEYAVPAPDGSARHAEAALYAGYSRRFRRWSVTGSVGRYTYPGSDYDWDYGEVGASIGFRDRVFLTASWTDDFFNVGAHALSHELAVALPVGAGFEVGAGIGRFRSSGIDVDYTHWNAGASKRIGRFGIDLRYYDSSHDAGRYGTVQPRRMLPGAPSDGEWVLSVSRGFDAGS
ncbi:MAG: hypothetical protein JXB36_02335 [Gammaproteobacteria bacterium]|nr:hypothetical protein [Gammaproteobacteria bacterium]